MPAAISRIRALVTIGSAEATDVRRLASEKQGVTPGARAPR